LAIVREPLFLNSESEGPLSIRDMRRFVNGGRRPCHTNLRRGFSFPVPLIDVQNSSASESPLRLPEKHAGHWREIADVAIHNAEQRANIHRPKLASFPVSRHGFLIHGPSAAPSAAYRHRDRCDRRSRGQAAALQIVQASPALCAGRHRPRAAATKRMQGKSRAASDGTGPLSDRCWQGRC
jgi:hypothetical protein